MRGRPRISVRVEDAESGVLLESRSNRRVHRTASIGKILLLIEVAARLEDGRLGPGAPLPCTTADAVTDSGLLQYLAGPSYAVADLAVLVGAVSDNFATNVLLRAVGLDAVTARAGALGLRQTALHDRVRERRGPADPSTLSTGTAAELTGLMSRLHKGLVASSDVSERVLRWLALDTDTSMVAAAFGLDPLAHADPDRGIGLTHKTGTDTGIRCDVGLVRGPAAAIAYAVLADFDDADRDDVLARMRAVGERIRAAAVGA